MKTNWFFAILIILLFAGSACGARPIEAEQGIPPQNEPTTAPTTQVETDSAAQAPAEAGESLLHWEGSALFAENQTECHQLTIDTDSQAYLGMCGQTPQPADLLTGQSQIWGEMVNRFAPLTAETPAGRIEFNGTGDIDGAAWERAVAAWARLTHAELASGRASATGPTVLAWNLGQLPDQPDTCQRLVVLVYGYATAGLTPCEGGQMEVAGSGWIDTADWEQFDAWLYNNAPFYQADSYLDGRGDAELSDGDAAALAIWAETVFDQISQTAGTPLPRISTAVWLAWNCPVSTDWLIPGVSSSGGRSLGRLIKPGYDSVIETRAGHKPALLNFHCQREVDVIQ